MRATRAVGLPAGLSILLLLLGCGDAPGSPDIVLVTWDTVRADHVGADGGTSATPNLDALARDGVAFSEARTPVPITLPAHASILTGLFPASHGVRDNGIFRLDAAIPTLQGRLAAEGFATGAFVSAQVLEGRSGLARGFEIYDDRVAPHPEVAVVPSRPADQTVASALAWLEEVPPERPVFLWVHLYDPHRMWEAPEPFSRRFDPYRAEIAFADDQTGRLLAGLEARGRLARSIVAIASDHGEGLGEHDEQTHAFFAYESTLRVPLVLWAGSEVGVEWARGRTLTGPASLVDLAPTLLELLGHEPGRSDGRSLVPHLAQGTPVAPRVHPLETVAPTYGYGTAPIFGLLTEDGETWIDLPRRERYHLAEDPDQLENRYVPADAERAEALFASVPRAWPPENAAREVDAETRAALQALGYAGSASLPPADAEPVDPKDRIEVANFVTVNRHDLTPTEALEQSAALVERHGPLPALAHFRAQMHDRLGKSRDAIEELARSVAEHPEHSEMAAELAGRRRDYDRRVQLARAIRDTLERQPDHPRARRDLALTLHQLQEVEEAEALYEAILRDTPEDDATRLNLIGLLMSRERVSDAMDLVEAALARPSHDPRLDCAAGRIFAWHLDRPARAVEALRACRDGGAPLTSLDQAILADASR